VVTGSDARMVNEGATPAATAVVRAETTKVVTPPAAPSERANERNKDRVSACLQAAPEGQVPAGGGQRANNGLRLDVQPTDVANSERSFRVMRGSDAHVLSRPSTPTATVALSDAAKRVSAPRAIARERVKVVNERNEGQGAGPEPVPALPRTVQPTVSGGATESRQYSEPIMQIMDSGFRLHYVGKPETDDKRQELFESFGTPGKYLKPGMILLPTEEAAYGDGSALHAETLTFINKYCQFPNGMDVLAAYYARLTWLFDAFCEVPYLRFRSMAFGMGKSRALEVVGSICRRAVMISGASSAASIRRIVDLCGGTLLIDEGDLDPLSAVAKDITRMFLTSFQRGRMICLNEPTKAGSWTPKGFEAFGPKVVAHHERFSSAALESRFIDCLMGQKTRDDIPIILPQPQFDNESLELRNKYLAYRRDHLSNVQLDPALKRPELEDRTNQIAIPLLSVVNEPADRETIVKALLAGQEQVKADIAITEQGAIAQELLDKGPAVSCVPLQELVDSVQFQFNFNAKQMGLIVRKMGLTVKHVRTGNVVILDEKAREQLRALLRVPPRFSGSPCSQRSRPPGERPEGTGQVLAVT